MHDRTRRAGRRIGGLLAVATFLTAWGPSPLQAKIDLVTLPQKDTTQLSIYKSEDITLVREQRELTFKQGANEIQFSWANTLIDPTSLQIRLVQNSPDFTLLDASYPANTQNTIVWNIEAKQEGKAKVEITYFASGLTWRADYTAIADAEEKTLRLEPNFTIFNSSGEEFENAQTRLVVGEINLVQAVAELARRGLIRAEEQESKRKDFAKMLAKSEVDALGEERMAMAPSASGAAFDQAAAKEILKQAVSEYYLYSIEGTEDLKDGWGKQLPNPRTDGVKFDLSYEYNPNKYGNQVVKFYKFKNDAEHKIGDVPLPEGTYYIHSADGKGGLRFQASFAHKYVPVGEDVELNLGSDGRVLYEERLMEQSRGQFEFDNWGNITGHDRTDIFEIEVRNSYDREIPIKITRNMGWEDWEITKTTDNYKKVDRGTVEWETSVPPLAKKVIQITVVTRQGSRARTN